MYQTPQGVPIRLELGPKDMEKKTVMLARRDTGVKESMAWDDVAARIPELLEQIQASQICFSSLPFAQENKQHVYKCCPNSC